MRCCISDNVIIMRLEIENLVHMKCMYVNIETLEKKYSRKILAIVCEEFARRPDIFDGGGFVGSGLQQSIRSSPREITK